MTQTCQHTKYSLKSGDKTLIASKSKELAERMFKSFLTSKFTDLEEYEYRKAVAEGSYSSKNGNLYIQVE